jgi:DNA-binding protein HU-beta
MNKADLISSIAEKSNLQKKDAEKVLNAFTETVEDVLTKGERIQLVGFGSFEVKQRAERKGRNPQTKAVITIPATKLPVFKVGKDLKEAVNK